MILEWVLHKKGVSLSFLKIEKHVNGGVSLGKSSYLDQNEQKVMVGHVFSRGHDWSIIGTQTKFPSNAGDSHWAWLCCCPSHT